MAWGRGRVWLGMAEPVADRQTLPVVPRLMANGCQMEMCRRSLPRVMQKPMMPEHHNLLPLLLLLLLLCL